MWEIGNYKLYRWYAIYSCTLYALDVNHGGDAEVKFVHPVSPAGV